MADFEGSLPIKTVAPGDVGVFLFDGAGVNKLAIDVNGAIAAVVTATDLDIRPLTSADTVTVVATDLDIRPLTNADVVTVEATDLDIRNLTAATDVVKIGDGVETLAINTDGSINAVTSKQLSGNVVDYGTSAAVAKDGTADFDYVVATGKTFVGSSIIVGTRGACKVTFGTYDGSTFVTKGVLYQHAAFNGPIQIPNLTLLGDGTALIRVTVKNLDAATDLFCTIQGQEF
jgi:hypothetical protein